MNTDSIAYFCAEYGLDHRLPIYAGGLGVLAGDTLKAAAEMDNPFIGIGLLYRGKKAQQVITHEGKQIEKDQDFNPLEVGLEPCLHQGEPLLVKVYLIDHFVWARVWVKKLSQKVELYLLDTNIEQNEEDDREINDALYFGDATKQLKQQFILGIGGMKLLAKLRIKPRKFHLNEGRPAFMYWQLLIQTMQQQNLDFYAAKKILKKQLVYTNHTLVAAGDYIISRDELVDYAKYYADKMQVSLDELLAPGLTHDDGGFSMTRFAMSIASRHSGVSQLHAHLSKQIWPQYDWQGITNGVHMQTWQDPRLAQADLGAGEIWDIHVDNKKKLQKFVEQRTGFTYDSQRLVIGWARRLAGYKRMDAVFAHVERLVKIVKNSHQPVQLLFAGKSHQDDHFGKDMLHIAIKKMAHELSGYALYIPDYNLEIANYLVKGCDVWLNIPERGKEACGTSGMKAVSNGVLQCTTLDGWADEVKWAGIGWNVESDNVSNSFYQVLEKEIQPLFYQRDAQGYSQKWVEMMKKSMQLAKKYSAKEMLRKYEEQLYLD